MEAVVEVDEVRVEVALGVEAVQKGAQQCRPRRLELFDATNSNLSGFKGFELFSNTGSCSAIEAGSDVASSSCRALEALEPWPAKKRRVTPAKCAQAFTSRAKRPRRSYMLLYILRSTWLVNTVAHLVRQKTLLEHQVQKGFVATYVRQK